VHEAQISKTKINLIGCSYPTFNLIYLKFQTNFYKDLLPGFLSHSSSGMKIFFIRTKKSPVSQCRKNNKVNTSSESHRKNQTTKDATNKKTKNTPV
jgi:hypothetical protein